MDSDKIVSTIVAVLTAVIGVSIVSVLVSRQSNTAGVLQAGGSAFSQILQTAVSPVSGGGTLGSIGNLASGLFSSSGQQTQSFGNAFQFLN